MNFWKRSTNWFLEYDAGVKTFTDLNSYRTFIHKNHGGRLRLDRIMTFCHRSAGNFINRHVEVRGEIDPIHFGGNIQAPDDLIQACWRIGSFFVQGDLDTDGNGRMPIVVFPPFIRYRARSCPKYIFTDTVSGRSFNIVQGQLKSIFRVHIDRSLNHTA